MHGASGERYNDKSLESSHLQLLFRRIFNEQYITLSNVFHFATERPMHFQYQLLSVDIGRQDKLTNSLV